MKRFLRFKFLTALQDVFSEFCAHNECNVRCVPCLAHFLTLLKAKSSSHFPSHHLEETGTEETLPLLPYPMVSGNVEKVPIFFCFYLSNTWVCCKKGSTGLAPSTIKQPGQFGISFCPTNTDFCWSKCWSACASSEMILGMHSVSGTTQHRTTEQVGWEGTFKGHLVQPSLACRAKNPLPASLNPAVLSATRLKWAGWFTLFKITVSAPFSTEGLLKPWNLKPSLLKVCSHFLCSHHTQEMRWQPTHQDHGWVYCARFKMQILS